MTGARDSGTDVLQAELTMHKTQHLAVQYSVTAKQVPNGEMKEPSPNVSAAAAALATILNSRGTSQQIGKLKEIVAGPDRGSSERAPGRTDMRDGFAEVQFRYTHLVPTQCVRPSSSVAELAQGYGVDCLYIVTGMCLFDERTLDRAYAHILSGMDDSDLLISAPFTIYELDKICRMTALVADVACAPAVQSESGAPILISVDIPSFQYYLPIIRAWKQNFCTRAGALCWIRAINQRRRRLWLLFRAALEHELRERKASAQSVQMCLTSTCETIGNIVTENHQLGVETEAAEVLAKLEHVSGWAQFLQGIPIKSIVSLEQLGRTIYPFECLRPLLSHKFPEAAVQLAPSVRSPVIIAVDDASERAVYTQAQNILRKLRSPQRLPKCTLLALYGRIVCRFVDARIFTR
ncbi:hypothetical protein CKM354_000784300 [Cercospora kikuchii]|uniref:Uncharacterized protein n=1 Tax=Cercospora kikuchii TaxID=84275 RepID=A0A9P3CK25_9PEZI|nr:uncharacterized protein CKM354_000784300 [Cercospora kikuchii]GIZ44652.1 hypothetical protein CKM354_000784300 [Cercospora kikuchii]